MNVTDLARQLGTTKEDLLEKLPSLGFDIGARAIKVDNTVAERIKKAWAEQAKREKLKEKMEKQSSAQKGEDKEGEDDVAEIEVGDTITVNDLADKLGTDVTHLIGYLMKNGIMASLNESIDFETASIIAEDYNCKAVRASSKEGEETDKKTQSALKELKENVSESEGGVERPSVVVVMGHVDHGKTTLLDAIRKTNVVEGESGGITQHIGAYQVEQKGSLITFLDTPGHEAFKAMRERGGQVADVAILVVAADDGLKPQTLESINVIQKECLPFVVAINKTDKPGADADRVKKDLSQINLVPEDWGGKTITSLVSAKKEEGIRELLDMVLLVADMEKFRANSEGPARGVIIESHVDKGEGPVATVLVKSGTLSVGDEVVIGDTYGKIKALKDWQGRDVQSAPPSTPVKILGLKSTPRVGDILFVQEIGRKERKKAPKKYRLIDLEKPSRDSSDESQEDQPEKNVFKIVVKADVLGSLEALLASIKKLDRKDVSIAPIKQGLGNITESDLMLAEDSSAVVYGFNVGLSQEAQKMSYGRSVEIKLSKVIYEILEDIENRLEEFTPTQMVEVKQGEVAILKVFKDGKDQSILGGKVSGGQITNNARFRLLRAGEPIDEGKIAELQRDKNEVSSAQPGDEIGIKVSGLRGFKEGDILSCFVEEKKRYE